MTKLVAVVWATLILLAGLALGGCGEDYTEPNHGPRGTGTMIEVDGVRCIAYETAQGAAISCDW